MTAFSPKQRTVLSWWVPGSPNRGKEAIVCDGAVRSGKTLAMGLSFFLWAMSCFSGQKFGVCGKTIASLRRNVLLERTYACCGKVRGHRLHILAAEKAAETAKELGEAYD